MSIIDISVKRPLLVVVLFTILTLLGVVCYSMLNLNLLPKFNASVVSITTIYPGASASEVENSVTKKLEDALSSLENVDDIKSTSQEGFSSIIIELKSNADVDLSIEDAQRKINTIMSTLPSTVKSPILNKFSSDDIPIMQIGATSDMPATKFYKLVDDRIKPSLSKLQGVGQISLSGGTNREIRINVDQEKLKAYKLSILQVLRAIQTANEDFPTGNVENKNSTYTIRLSAKFSSVDELGNTIITTTPAGGKIKVSDVAEVLDGAEDQDQLVRVNNESSIGLQILKQSDANAVAVADQVKKELKTIEKDYASDHVKFFMAYDNSEFTRSSANAVVKDLILAILIVSLVCFLFLHSTRSAMIVMIAVPMSMIPSFIFMYLFGYSLNMMSLMALSLVVGILVDDSIVVMENMYRHMEMGKSKKQAALEGCKQILLTATSITMVIVIVFMPLAISSGLVGKILHEFSMPIIMATLTSLLVSFTFTPMLVSKFGKLQDLNKQTAGMKVSRKLENILDSLKNMYGRGLAYSLEHKKILISITFILLIGAFSLVGTGLIGSAFIPDMDQGEINLTLEMEPQTTVYQNNLLTQKVEDMIMKKPEVENVFTVVGASTNRLSSQGKKNITQISIKLVDKEKRIISSEKFALLIKKEVSKLPGIKVTANTSNSSTSPIQIIVKGSDLSTVQNTAAMVKQVIKNTPGSTDVNYSIADPQPEIQIKLDRDKMSELGLSVADVGMTLQTALAGNDDSKYREGSYEYDIKVMLDKFDKSKVDDVNKLSFVNSKGQLIELNQFASVSQTMGASMLERYNRITSITVNSNVSGRPVGTVGAEIKEKLKNKIPAGITIDYAGNMKQQSDAFGTLAFSMIAAILLVYLIMVALYDSLLYPFVVLFSIPLAAIGALLALALTMDTLNIFSIVGMITLIGLVAKNAILLVDFTNHLKEEGLPVKQALIEAGRERLRPILMTTMAMVFGMLPIALAQGSGSEIKSGMAWVIIGGLISSLLLTLIIVPVVYLILENIKNKVNRFRHRHQKVTLKEVKMETIKEPAILS
ncbi:MAG: efflux RND transporter permease subunit [Bacteroidota bacterium]|nr:efflux RND transporter permease subunit [Bacteroidota bacterium]